MPTLEVTLRKPAHRESAAFNFKKSVLALSVGLAIVSLPAFADSISISSYDFLNTPVSGFGGWSNVYSGTITPTGNSINSYNLFNYTGGSGTLNDGIIPTSSNNNQLFLVDANPVINLYLSSLSQISSIDLYGGNSPGNEIPGRITGVTVTIDGISDVLSATGWGSQVCYAAPQRFCNGNVSLTGTPLAGITTNTVTLSNFTGNFFNGFAGYSASLGEVAVNGTTAAPVPEPGEYMLMLMGFGLTGFYAKRRKKHTV